MTFTHKFVNHQFIWPQLGYFSLLFFNGFNGFQWSTVHICVLRMKSYTYCTKRPLDSTMSHINISRLRHIPTSQQYSCCCELRATQIKFILFASNWRSCSVLVWVRVFFYFQSRTCCPHFILPEIIKCLLSNYSGCAVYIYRKHNYNHNNNSCPCNNDRRSGYHTLHALRTTIVDKNTHRCAISFANRWSDTHTIESPMIRHRSVHTFVSSAILGESSVQVSNVWWSLSKVMRCLWE